MWSSSARQINYGLPSEMGMVGLRDVFLVAPASFHHASNQHQESTINFDPHAINVSNALGVGVGVGVNVIPLLTSVGVDENVLNNSRTRGGAVHLWQNQQSQMKKPAILDHSGGSNLLQGGNGCGIGSSASTNTTTTTCQDCGNQAKKDCSHRRCRTCCKSRGYDCSTHVKSTWVPAARRRERQLMAAAAAAAGSSQSISSAKKPKLAASQTTTGSHTSTSNNTPPISFDTGSSHQDAGFKDLPGQVRAPAVFKCVRVTSIDDGEDEYAYQAVVKIGGHVFKGFLYDQGHEERDGFPNISDLHLGAGGGNNGGGRNGASSSSPILDPSDVYAISTGGLLGGLSSYGNPIN